MRISIFDSSLRDGNYRKARPRGRAFRSELVRDVHVVLVLLDLDLVGGLADNVGSQIVFEGMSVGKAAADLVAELAREAKRQVMLDDRGRAKVHVHILCTDRRFAIVVANADRHRPHVLLHADGIDGLVIPAEVQRSRETKRRIGDRNAAHYIFKENPLDIGLDQQPRHWLERQAKGNRGRNVHIEARYAGWGVVLHLRNIRGF